MPSGDAYFNPMSYSNQFRSEFRERVKIGSDTILFGYFGRIVRDKGIHDLYEAWQRSKNELKFSKLLLIGDIERNNSISADIFNKIQLDNTIILLPFENNIARYYSVIDVFVLPSYREGLPVTLLEASSMAIPIIATNISGNDEVVEHNYNGVLYSVSNIDQLSNAIKN